MEKNIIREYANIEEDFFEIDKSCRTASIKLRFGCPSEIFDVNCISKTAVFNDDFIEWLSSAFELVPSKYRVNIEILFSDFEGWTEEELKDVFEKNLFLEYKRKRSKEKARAHIAYGLIVLGVVLFAAMILTNKLWVSDSIFKEVFSYAADIATTVVFWEAMTILVVERRENAAFTRSLAERFGKAEFKKAEAREKMTENML